MRSRCIKSLKSPIDKIQKLDQTYNVHRLHNRLKL
uniref:Uncharacterized protein n=1 Tax=Rhizophora mucronata TaxID=61149 RepID=A0A2P2IXY3_RHIMU